jgi:hypothetical protein
MSKGSTHVDCAGGAEEMSESECGERDEAGVVAWVDEAEQVEERVSLPLLLEIRLECTMSGSAATASALPSMSSLRRLVAGTRGSSPESSGGNVGPCKKLSTAAEAVL